MALAETAKLVVALKLDDKFSGPIKSVGRELSGLDAKMGRLGRLGSTASRGVGTLVGNVAKLGAIAGGVAIGGLAFAVVTASKFESAFAGVAKTVDATGPELAALEDDFRSLARTIPVSFEELAGIGEQGGALGIAKEDLVGFTDVVAKLASTTDLSAEDAATSLGQLSNVLGLTADEYDNFGAALVDLGNKGASTESQIVGIASRAGAAGELIGLSTDEVLGFSAAVADLGIEVEAGGSSIQTFFLKTLKNINNQDALGVMAETAGTTGEAFKEAFEEDATGALTTFIKGLSKLEASDQLAVLAELGFKDVRITRTLLGLAGNVDGLTKSLKNSALAWKTNTALEKEFGKRQQTLASQFQILQNNVRDAAATFGTALLPSVQRVITAVNELFVDKQPQIETFARRVGKAVDRLFNNKNIDEGVDQIGGFIDKLAAFDPKKFKFEFDSDGKTADLADSIGSIAERVKSLPWESIGNAARLLGTGSKALLDAFLGLPGWVQTAVLTGWGLNKLTGGALGSIVGELSKGIIKGVLGIQAAQVNIQAANVTGLTPGAPTPTGGGRGAALVGGVIATAGILATIEGGFSTITKGLEGDAEDRNDALLTLAGGFPALIAQAVSDAFGFNQEPDEPKDDPKDDKPQPVTDDGVAKTLDQVDHGIAAVEGRIKEANKARVINRGAVIAALLGQKAELVKERNEIVRNRTAILADTRETSSRIKTGFTDNGAKIARMHSDTSGHLSRIRDTELSNNARLAAIQAKKTSFHINNTVNVNTQVEFSATATAIQIRRVTSTTGNLQDFEALD